MNETIDDLARERIAQAYSQIWWLMLLRGILLIIVGCYALFRPGMTAAALAMVIGVFLIFDGVLAILVGLFADVPSRGWTIVRGVVEILVGVAALVYPLLVAGATTTLLLYLLALGAIVGGIMEVIAAIRDRKEIEGEGWLIVGGLLAICLGALLLAAPLTFGQILIRVLGVFAIVNGIALIAMSFRLKGLPKAIKQLSS